MTLVCEPADYRGAAEALTTTSEDLAGVRDTVVGGLSTSAGMAGVGEAADEFAGSYDAAVFDCVSALRTAEEASAQLGTLIDVAGLNHARADGQSADLVVPPRKPGALTIPPSASSNSADAPWGWSLIENAVDFVWPTANSNLLRVAAHAWNLAAAGCDTAAFPVADAERLIERQVSPEVPHVVAQCVEYRDQVHALAEWCRQIGDVCSGFAADVDLAHAQANELLEEFLWETALLGTISAAGTVFTAGGSAVGGAAAFGANVARYAPRIAAVLRVLLDAAGAVGGVLRTVADKVRDLAAALRARISSRSSVLADEAPALVETARATLTARLADAQVWKGPLLPVFGGPPNQLLVKLDPRGRVLNYSEYDADGIALTRVDLQGRPHHTGEFSIPTPHVVDIVRNVNPRTGQVFPRTDSGSIRPALAQEVPFQ